MPPAASGTASSASRPRLELPFLDGLRAVAALYVVVYHAFVKFTADPARWPDAGTQMPVWTAWMRYGNLAVDVFIVLSGFVLMLPVAVAGTGKLTGGFRNYLQRRARRILPPYYAALIFSCLLLVANLFLARHSGSGTRGGDDLKLGPLLSHLFLVQNLSPAWDTRINAPMWSVATEWQIYFLFPALLLPVFRKAGSGAALAVGLILGIVPAALGWAWAGSARTWLFGLFALGMVAAVWLVDKTRQESTDAAQKTRQSFGIGAAGIALVVCAGIVLTPVWYAQRVYAFEILTGMETAALILYCAPAAVRTDLAKPWALRALESRGATGLGLFSYSLYLTHGPLLAILYQGVVRLHHSLPVSLLALLIVGVPASVAFAYVFYLAFEKPFLSRRRFEKPSVQTEQAILRAPEGTLLAPEGAVSAAK